MSQDLITAENPSGGGEPNPSGSAASPAGVAPGMGGDGKGTASAEGVNAFPLGPITRVGAYMTGDHRYWFNGKGPYPSVTTILKIMDKPAVYQWAKKTVAEYAVANMTELSNRIGVQGPEEAAKWLASLPDYKADTAGKLGTSVHLLADMVSRASESDAEGFAIDPEALPFIQGFRGFLERYGASSIISSEKMVVSIADGYAGTFDLLMMVDDALWLIDIKTSKGYYPEYGLQLAAYANAEAIILKDDPVLYPMPLVQRAGVLHLRPDQYPDTGWRLVEYPIDHRDYVAFLAARELWGWKTEGRFTKSKLQSL